MNELTENRLLWWEVDSGAELARLVLDGNPLLIADRGELFAFIQISARMLVTLERLHRAHRQHAVNIISEVEEMLKVENMEVLNG